MSKPQVTITLGRTGQVVKRGGVASEDARVDTRPLSGSKRSIRERLGSNAESSLLSANKRQRGDGSEWSQGNNGVNGARVGRNDLRLKLLRKNQSRRTQGDVEERKKTDLRDKLSRTVQAPVRVNMVPHRPEPKDSSLLRRIPPTKSAADLIEVDSLRESYPSWTMDGLRSRSPDRILKTSRGLSPPRSIGELRRSPPPRSIGELRQVPSMRSINSSRTGQYLSNDVIEPSRPTGAMPITMKTSLDTSKPVTRLPPTNGIMHKSSYMGEEPLTVASLLHSLGLGKYAINFQAEEVDMTALRQMGDNDLKEMGIPMGPRKKILLAIMPRSKRQPP